MWLLNHKLMMRLNHMKIIVTAFTLDIMIILLMDDDPNVYHEPEWVEPLETPTSTMPLVARLVEVDKILTGLGQGIVTRSQLMNFCAHFSFVSSIEPLRVDQALEDPDCLIAMHDAINSFSRKRVWYLVERPFGHDHNIIGTKWIFKINMVLSFATRQG